MTSDLRITALRRHPQLGYWTAHVTVAGITAAVDLRYGSWQLTENGRHGRKDLVPHVAAALQARIKPLERRERAETVRASEVEHRARMAEFRQLRPSAHDLRRYSEQLWGDLAHALERSTLVHIWTRDELSWARPESWGERCAA